MPTSAVSSPTDLVAGSVPRRRVRVDGFGVVHRKQASVYEIAQRLPHFAGYLWSKRDRRTQEADRRPRPAYVVVLGGSKVSDKLGVITSLLPRVDSLLIGGGMAFTFPGRAGLRRRRGHAAGRSDRDV